MTNLASSTELHISDYLSEVKAEIFQTIDKEHRVLIHANPGAGKTQLFKKLAKDITTNKVKGKLVFTAPYLIILEQFNNDLALDKIKVDLELKGTSKRKKLLNTDRIITSTYQSLWHIIDDLTADDILVVDEAHALYHNYQQSMGLKQFYTKTIQNLYHTRSKLVLMSGTPNLSLLSILRLHHVIIHKQNNLQAQIELEYCNLNSLEVVKVFSKQALLENGTDKLNIIYRKSVNDCIKISQMLIDEGYKTEVITSLHKDSDTYNSIVETQIVPQEVQFLVTTNVISTGTNINNSNIGNALMLDEYSPQEIKQFSKRFRGKLDLKVIVVNKGYVKGMVTYSDLDIKKQQRYLSDALNNFETLKNTPNINFDYSDSYDKTELGSPNSLISQTLERYLKQESFYIDDAQNSYDSPAKLAAELNEYDDIHAQVIYDYDAVKKLNFQLGIDNRSKKIDAKFEAKIVKLIAAFEQEPKAYLSAMVNENIMDYYSKNKVRSLVAKELPKQHLYSDEVVKNLKSLLFNRNILMPFLQYRVYFNSTTDFIKLLKSKKNKNSYLSSLVFNRILTDHFEIATTQTIHEPTLSTLTHYLIPKGTSSSQFRSNELKVILRLIELTFDYCYDEDKVIVDNLKQVLESDLRLKKLISETQELTSYPLNTISVKTNDFSINDYFVKGLIQGIFYTNQKLVKKVVKGIPLRAVKLKDKLPVGYDNRKLDVSSNVFGLNPRVTAKSISKTRTKKPLIQKGNTNFNFINSYDLIVKEQM